MISFFLTCISNRVKGSFHIRFIRGPELKKPPPARTYWSAAEEREADSGKKAWKVVTWEWHVLLLLTFNLQNHETWPVWKATDTGCMREEQREVWSSHMEILYRLFWLTTQSCLAAASKNSLMYLFLSASFLMRPWPKCLGHGRLSILNYESKGNAEHRFLATKLKKK